jgi:LPS export ABC transporter protein LptC
VSGAAAERLRARIGSVLLAVIILSAAGGVLWYRRTMREEGTAAAPPAGPRNSSKAQMVTRDFKHVEMRMDRVVWILEAKQAEMFEDTARLSAVKITYYGEKSGQAPVVITSRRGVVSLTKHDADLSGDVRAVRADGATLETDRLVWEDAEKTLTAPTAVTIRSRRMTLRGDKMWANVTGQWVKVSGGVRADVIPPRDAVRGAGEERRGANS